MAYTIKRNAYTTSSRPLPGSDQPPQHTITKATHYENKHTTGCFSPSSPINTSPLSRCSSTSSDLSFCSLTTPTASSVDSGDDEDEGDDQDYDSDYDYDEDEESEDDDDEMVVELISILKKPRDPSNWHSIHNDNGDNDNDDGPSECEVVFERNVAFTDPLATDLMTGDIVQPSRLSREEWTALKLRESIERSGFLVDCKNGKDTRMAEHAGLLEDEDEDEEGNEKNYNNDSKDSDEEMHDNDDSDSDVEIRDAEVEGLVFEAVNTIVCHTQTQPQTKMRHRSTKQIRGVDLRFITS